MQSTVNGTEMQKVPEMHGAETFSIPYRPISVHFTPIFRMSLERRGGQWKK